MARLSLRGSESNGNRVELRPPYVVRSPLVRTHRELFTNKSVSTVRSVPYYDSGEIFLTRLVSFLGDTFTIHDSNLFPQNIKIH